MNKQITIEKYVALAKKGTQGSVALIMEDLTQDISLAQSKFIDYALGEVETSEGIETLKHYLFNGSLIQRNYCALYFGRKGEYLIVRRAYDEGLIDAKQAFSR